MSQAINQPFRSEAYDRLMADQARHHDASAVLDSRNIGFEAMANALREPVTNADALKTARTQLGWSQARLGEALGLSAPQLSLMETGKAPVGASVDLAIRALLAASVMP